MSLMPYEQLEEVRSRKQEKVALFLTAHYMAGMLCAVMPIYIATLTFPFLLRALILVTAAILGLSLTLELGGLPVYERLLWRVRGAVRIRTSSRTLTPEQFTGVPVVQVERALPANGPIRVVYAEARRTRRQLRLGHQRH